jgi:hypothetical protein
MIARSGSGSVRLNRLALDPGRYIVELSGALPPEQEYRFNVSDAGPRPPGVALDPNDTLETASRIVAGQGISGTLSKNDSSHYLAQSDPVAATGRHGRAGAGGARY